MGDESNIVSFLLVLVALLAVHIFCVLAAAAMSKSRVTALQARRDEDENHEHRAQLNRAERVLTNADNHLLALQTGEFASAVMTGVLCIAFAQTSGFGALLGRAINYFTPVSHGIGEFVAASVVFVIVAAITLPLVQAAKAVVLAAPERSLLLFSPLILLLSKLSLPIVLLLNRAVRRASRMLGVGATSESGVVATPAEIQALADASVRLGSMRAEERDMIEGVLSLSETVVREVMTPRSDIVSVEESASLEEVARIFTQEGVSRMLVTGANLDDVKGVVLAKDFMRFFSQARGEGDYKKLIRPAFFVHNHRTIHEVLQQLKHQAVHLAVVLDEHGGVDGLVTIEDLIEEIVGEIFDEYDSPIEETPVRRTRSGDLLVDGSVVIDDLNEQYQLNFPQGEYDTIAGFVIQLLGRIPEVGEILDYEGVRIRVEEMDQNRITRLRLINPKRANNLQKLEGDSFETSAPSSDSNQESAEKPPKARALGSR